MTFFFNYVYSIIYLEYIYKFGFLIKFNQLGIVRLFFTENINYDSYVFSRFFKNLRLNYFNSFNFFTKKRFLYDNRGNINNFLYKLIILIKNKLNYGLLFERLLFVIYRSFSEYSTSIYLNAFIKSYFIKLEFQWSDIYARLFDLYEIMVDRDNIFYKCDLPKMNFSLVTLLMPNNFDFFQIFKNNLSNVNFLKYCFLFYSFFGLDLFLRKKKFKYSFFSKII